MVIGEYKFCAKELYQKRSITTQQIPIYLKSRMILNSVTAHVLPTWKGGIKSMVEYRVITILLAKSWNDAPILLTQIERFFSNSRSVYSSLIFNVRYITEVQHSLPWRNRRISLSAYATKSRKFAIVRFAIRNKQRCSTCIKWQFRNMQQVAKKRLVAIEITSKQRSYARRENI